MKSVDVYMDLQSLHNFAVRALGNLGSTFMNKPNPQLQLQTPTTFYMEQPSPENYKKILTLVEQTCSQYN